MTEVIVLDDDDACEIERLRETVKKPSKDMVDESEAYLRRLREKEKKGPESDTSLTQSRHGQTMSHIRKYKQVSKFGGESIWDLPVSVISDLHLPLQRAVSEAHVKELQVRKVIKILLWVIC